MIFAKHIQNSDLQNICSIYTNLTKCFSIVATIGLLTSCSSQPSTLSSSSQEAEVISQSSENFLDLAARSSGSLAEYYRLQAFKRSVLDEEYMLAEELKNQINYSLLSEEDKISGQLSELQFLINEDQATQALALLQAGAQVPSLAAEWNYRMGQAQIALGNHDIAKDHYYRCSNTTSNTHDYPSLCAEELWQSLLDNGYTTGVPAVVDQKYQAWVQLAEIIQSNRGLIENQSIALQSWFFENIDHPARINPPAEVIALIQSEVEAPLSVALILPLSGRLQTAGEAVLDGFLSALYRTGAENYATPHIEIFDSSQLPIELIAELVADGNYDVAIGPLDAGNVGSFISSISNEQAVLSLNRMSYSENRSPMHLGYSLAVESEAAQSAQSAYERDYKSAMLLIEDTGIGERAAGAFAEQWISEDRHIQDLVRLSEATTITERLEQSFHVDQSETRKSQLQTLLGKRLEFTPRRRQDIDTIFLASNPILARQVAPTLAFLFAQDVPVLAISRIYESSADLEDNRDLEPVEFLSPPWLIENRQSLEQAESSRPLELQKLEAMGVDAFYLSRRFEQLNDPSFVYQGKTGNIYMGSTGNLERTMEWVKLDGNQLAPTEH